MGKIVVTKDRGLKLWAKFALVTLCSLLLSAFIDKPAFALNPIMHNSSTMGNKYGSWGLNKDCAWCHTSTPTDNVKMISGQVNTPTGYRSVTFYRMTASFNNATGVLGNDLRTYNPVSSTNICEVCHHQTKYHRYSTAPQTGHYNNELCTQCHSHAIGFKAQTHGVPLYAGANHEGHTGCSSPASGCHLDASPLAPYPAATAGAAPDCQSCHKMGDPLSVAPVYGCGSCHGEPGGNGEPSGTVHPNAAGSHVIHTAIGGVTCVRCHSSGGTGSTVNHGSSNKGTVVGFVNVTSTAEPIGWRNSNSTCANASCHVDVYGTGFISTPAWGTPSGCSACHTTPIGNTGPATGSHNVSGHAVDCEYCHAAGTTNSTIPSTGHNNTTINIAGTGSVIPAVGYPANVAKHASGGGYSSCTTAQCHSNVYGAGYITTPAWGNSAAGCAACHTAPYPFQTYGAPATGSHDKHMTTIVGVGCGDCHTGAVKDVSGGPVVDHGNGLVDVKDSLLYVYSTVYDGANPRPKHLPNTPRPESYGTCSASCHASPYNALNIESPVWGASVGCDSCHMADGAFLPGLGGAPNTGSHDKHMAQSAACGDCHAGAVSGVTGGNSHPNTVVNVSSGYTASPVVKHDPGIYTGYCNNASCHSNGRGGQINTPVWGLDNSDCTICHGGNSTSVNPIATQRHRSHMNNYTALGRNNNLKCAACHALTVALTSDRFVTTPANHFNTIYNYSGARAGGSANYNLATTVCNNGYCHSSGQAVPVYMNMTGGLAWNGAKKLDCSGCHGNSAGASWSTTLGAPNYHNNSTTTRNSHERHVAAMITATTGCSRCHNGTVSGSTAPDRLKDDNQAHINRVRDVNFSVFGIYSSRTMSCTAYCHSNVQAPGGNGPATIYAKPSWGVNGGLTCSSCHNDMANLAETAENLALGSHRRHATFDHSTSGTSGAGYDCSLCHGAGYSATTTNDSIHANQKITVALTGKAAGSAYTQYSGAPGNGYGTCSTSRCHGRAVRSWGINSTNPTCEKCHGSARTAQAESPTFYDTTISSQQYAGAHVRHLNPLSSDPVSCNSCHTVPTDISSFGHMSSMNGVVSVQVVFKGLARYTSLQTGNSMTPVYTQTGDLATSTCNNTYCHGGFKATAMGSDSHPAWGNSAYFGCGKCHGAPPGGAHPAVPQSSCNSCHDHVDGTGTGFTNKSRHVNGVVETTADDCLVCHADESSSVCVDNIETPDPNDHYISYDHSQACFPISLKGGHATHTDVEYFLAGRKLSNGDYIDPNWIYSIKYKKGFPQFACGFCHPMDAAAHKAGVVSVDLDPASAQLGTVKAKNKARMTTPPAGNYNTWMKTYIPFTKQGQVFTPGTVVCNNVYCHSNGYVSPETNAYIFTETPDWYYADKNGGTSFWAGKDNCAQCHGNSPNTDPNDGQGLKVGSPAHGRHVVGNHYKDIFNGYSGKLAVAAASGARGHGNPANSTTFNCNICHYKTVRAAFNDKGSVCTDCHNGTTASLRGTMQLYTTNASSHVNGIVNIDFMTPFNVKSKAQVRDSLNAVQGLYTSWTRVRGYKSYSSSHDHARQTPVYVGGTCSTVTCHNGTPMEWRSKGPLSCSACHTSLTN